MHCSGEVGGLPIPGGLLPGGACSWVVSSGGPAPGGDGGVPAFTEAAPLPVNRMIDRCKNITLPQTLFAGGIE